MNAVPRPNEHLDAHDCYIEDWDWTVRCWFRVMQWPTPTRIIPGPDGDEIEYGDGAEVQVMRLALISGPGGDRRETNLPLTMLTEPILERVETEIREELELKYGYE